MVGKRLDLEAAYKQCAVAPSQKRLAVVGLKKHRSGDIDCDEWCTELMRTYTYNPKGAAEILRLYEQLIPRSASTEGAASNAAGRRAAAAAERGGAKGGAKRGGACGEQVSDL